jgi:hypothetical protein
MNVADCRQLAFVCSSLSCCGSNEDACHSDIAVTAKRARAAEIRSASADQRVATRGKARVRPATGSNFEETRSSGPSNRLATLVYPTQLEEWIEFQGEPALLRPIRPDDLAQHQRLLARVTREDMRMRFFTAIGELPPPDLERLTQLDYDRDLAFIVVSQGGWL